MIGEASISEVFRVLSQLRSLNKRVVESQNMEEGSQSEFIYTRSLKFRAVEKEGRNTRSRKKKKKLKKLKKLTKLQLQRFYLDRSREASLRDFLGRIM